MGETKDTANCSSSQAHGRLIASTSLGAWSIFSSLFTKKEKRLKQPMDFYPQPKKRGAHLCRKALSVVLLFPGAKKRREERGKALFPFFKGNDCPVFLSVFFSAFRGRR